MCTRISRTVLLFGITFAAVCCTLAIKPALAAVKVIGDFEGNMTSGYAGVNWTTAAGITVPVDFVSIVDADYRGGVTHGEQALLLTTPSRWMGDDFLQIYPNEGLLNDTADFPYLLFDVTTYGDPATPDEGPVWRQMFSIFNGAVLGWYDSNPDHDIQHDFPTAGFADQLFTSTIVVDMTGPNPAVNGDGKNFLNLQSQAIRADHNDGTPIDPFYWGMHLVFQGDDQPISDQIQVVIDNVRFCSTLDCSATVPAGDYNNNGAVDAADYVVWRDGGPLQNETASIGTVDQADYDEWRRRLRPNLRQRIGRQCECPGSRTGDLDANDSGIGGLESPATRAA